MFLSRYLGLVAVALLVFGNLAAAAQVDYFNYKNSGASWSDAEKSPANPDDDYMCWAATASNVLQYTGWGAASGLKTSDAIFSYFNQHWSDQGGLMQYGWDWWFDGTNDTQGFSGWSQVESPGGNFFPTVDFAQYFHKESNAGRAATAIAEYLRAGYGVGLGVYGAGGHAITCWGYKFDDVTNQALGIWVTDSDDSKSTTAPPDLLQYYALDYLGGKYYLKNFYGTTDVWYIGEVEGLALKPDGTPNPPSPPNPPTPPPPPPPPPPPVVSATAWKAGSAAWENKSNWDHGTPTSDLAAIVDNGGTVSISSAAFAKELDLGVNRSGSAQLLKGSLTLTSALVLGGYSRSSGSFTISGGALNSPTVYVGKGGSGVFTQSGGTVTISASLLVGYSFYASGRYDLRSGTLRAATETIGSTGAGVFNQSGGANVVGSQINIGTVFGSGAYNISGGSLDAKNIFVGAHGLFNITNKAASIRVTGDLGFRDSSHFNAVAGSKIVLSGGNVIALVRSQSDLPGLKNTEFVFNGGDRIVSQFVFQNMAGGGGNFSIGRITLGDSSGVGFLRLKDLNAANSKTYGVDSLALSSLVINGGSWLDLYGFKLVVPGDLAGTIDTWIASRMLRDSSLGSVTYSLDAVYDSKTRLTSIQAFRSVTVAGSAKLVPLSDLQFDTLFLSDEIATIPEPSALALLAPALLALAFVARRFRR